MNKNALICEDNLTSATCIKTMLEKMEYKVDIAHTAADALACLRKNKYDLLTLDILLPDENGLDMVNEMQDIELTKDLPIIVISALKKESMDLDFKNNIVYWVEKSFDMRALEEAIDHLTTKKNKDKTDILHVENDEDLLSLIEITLSDIGNVTQCNNLVDAKTLLEEKKFDIIILDYVFPNGTSDKLIPTIKSGINKTSKLVMFSAYEESKVVKRYFDEIIIKTNISFDEFKMSIEKYIP